MTHSRPYTTPVWRAIRRELNAFDALKETNAKSRCEITGLERKLRRCLGSIACSSSKAVYELSFVRCIERISASYNAKGGCGNTTSGRIISIMTNGRLF